MSMPSYIGDGENIGEMNSFTGDGEAVKSGYFTFITRPSDSEAVKVKPIYTVRYIGFHRHHSPEGSGAARSQFLPRSPLHQGGAL